MDVSRRGHTATLAIEPFVALADFDAGAVTDEGERLLGFVAQGAETRDVRLLPLAA